MSEMSANYLSIDFIKKVAMINFRDKYLDYNNKLKIYNGNFVYENIDKFSAELNSHNFVLNKNVKTKNQQVFYLIFICSICNSTVGVFYDEECCFRINPEGCSVKPKSCNFVIMNKALE